MRKWRENNERNSEDVVELWETILEDKAHKLGSESKSYILTVYNSDYFPDLIMCKLYILICTTVFRIFSFGTSLYCCFGLQPY